MAGRQETFEASGYTIIKDCYNAGPESMAAALEVLGSKPGRRIAVLGDMLELGHCAEAEHIKLGNFAGEKADFVLAYGPNGCHVVKGALEKGVNPDRAKAFTDREVMAECLKRIAKPGDVLMFKGSRGMHMELVLEQFLKEDK